MIWRPTLSHGENDADWTGTVGKHDKALCSSVRLLALRNKTADEARSPVNASSVRSVSAEMMAGPPLFTAPGNDRLVRATSHCHDQHGRPQTAEGRMAFPCPALDNGLGIVIYGNSGRVDPSRVGSALYSFYGATWAAFPARHSGRNDGRYSGGVARLTP
jgi:hypothetical protein